MALKPQDVVLVLKLAVPRADAPTLTTLAKELALSVSEVHAATRRARDAGLLQPDVREPVLPAVRELVLHGVRYVFYPERIGITRGMPTAHSAPPLRELLADTGAPPLLWPASGGTARGEGLKPLYPRVPDAAAQDGKLHEMLALIDAIRVGGARNRKLARELLADRLTLPAEHEIELQRK